MDLEGPPLDRAVDTLAESHYPNPKLRAADAGSGWRGGATCPVCAGAYQGEASLLVDELDSRSRASNL